MDSKMNGCGMDGQSNEPGKHILYNRIIQFYAMSVLAQIIRCYKLHHVFRYVALV